MGQRQRGRRQHTAEQPDRRGAAPDRGGRGAGSDEAGATDPADVARLLGAALDSAVTLLRPEDREGCERSAESLVDLAARLPQGPLRCEVVVRTRLLAGVAAAWERGWQPADLVRHGRRSLAAEQVRLLVAAIAADLARHPADTIDPRWAAQLAEAGAEVARQGGVSVLTAHAEDAPLGWLGAVADAIAVTGLLARLTPLEVLGPVPGRGRVSPPASPRDGAGRGAASAVRPDVDERLLARVRQLLAKAESTTFEAEAETFTAGAQALMARHSIDAALLAAAGPAAGGGRTAGVAGTRIGIDAPYEHAKAVLLSVVADANRCRSIWTQHYGHASVVGFPADLAAVEVLFTSLLVQATAGMTGEGVRGQPSRSKAFRRSFLLSFATRIGERLAEAVAAETAAAAAEQVGSALVPVLAARAEEVEAAVAERFPGLVSRRTSAASDAEGWWAGRSAADRASLAAGAQLPGGGR